MSELSETPVAPKPAGRTARPEATVRAGQPYHLLARNSVHRWWRPLVALLLFVLVGFLVLIAATLALWAMALAPQGLPLPDLANPGVAGAVLNEPMFLLFSGFASLVATIPAVLMTVRWAQKRPLSSVTGVVGKLRWKWFGRCGLIALGVFAPAFAIEIGYELLTGTPDGPGFPGWVVYARVVLIALLVVPLQSAAEEYVFRGFLLQTFTAWFRTPWIGMVLSSVLFLLGHGYTDPLVWCQLLLMAISACWLTIRTGGLEAAIAMHGANNVLSLLIEGTSGVPGLEQAGDFAVMSVLPFLVAIPVYTWLADRFAARDRLDTVIGGRLRIAPLSLRPRTRDDLPPVSTG